MKFVDHLGLTDEQEDYVSSAGDAVLLACPGSGKTAACSRRFIARCQRDPPYGIAYVSYTNAAVDEALNRIIYLSGIAYNIAPNFIGTLDGFCTRFIFLPFIEAVVPEVPGDITIFDVPPPQLRRGGFTVYNGTMPFPAYDVRFRIINGAPGFYEGKASHSTSVDLAKKYRAAKAAYLQAGFASHNDILYWCSQILKRSPRVAKIIATRFGEIIVDEAQDTSPPQQEILRILQQAGSQVSPVGDPDQSIYQFNDAHPAYLRDEHASSANKHSLSINHRSSSQIVGVVNAHFGAAMRARFSTVRRDAVFVVVGPPEECIREFERLIVDAGIDPATIAVLIRDRATVDRLCGGYSVHSTMNDGVKRIVIGIQALESGDLQKALASSEGFLRAILEDAPERDRNQWRPLAWRFLRSYLPVPGDETYEQWIQRLRDAAKRFSESQSMTLLPNLNQKLTAKGFPKGESALQLVGKRASKLRTTTIHETKGESIAAVLLYDTDKQHAAWRARKGDEAHCLSYVAMTRAERLLVLGCESSASTKHWLDVGARVATLDAAPH